MATPQSMEDTFIKYNVTLGEVVKVGINKDSVFCASATDQWSSESSYEYGYVVGAIGPSLVVAFPPESVPTGRQYGAHSAIARHELAPEFASLHGSPIFRIILDKEAFKKNAFAKEVGRQCLVARATGDQFAESNINCNKNLTSVEATVVGANDYDLIIHKNSEYNYLHILGHNADEQKINRLFYKRVKDLPSSCWYVDPDASMAILTMPKKFDDIALGDRVQIPYADRRLASYKGDVKFADGYVNATIVGIGEFGPIAYIDDQDVSKVVGPHEQNQAYRIADRFVHDGIKLTNKQFWMLNDPTSYIKIHEATPVEQTTNSQITHNSKVGLRLGDNIIINDVWVTAKVPAQIVGFDTLGHPLARIIKGDFGLPANNAYLRALHSDYQEAAKNYKYWFLSADVPDEWEREKQTTDTKSFNSIIDNQTVNGKGNVKGEVIMDNNSDRKFFDMVKSDATEAAYRVASKQITKGTKSALLSLLEKQGGSSDGLKAFSEMMDTEIGEAVLGLGLGLGLTHLPLEAAQGERVQKLAEEFRINGMSTAGNAVFETAMEYIMPVITSALASLPAVEEHQQARVASTNSSSEEYIEETHLPAKQARV